jgi:flagellar hook-length control protein FliK
VRLRLEPPELGTVLIEVRLAGSTVSARLEADRADTAAALAEGLPLLRHALATDGVRIERFEITAREAPAGAPSPTDADGGAAADQGRERERAPAPPPPHPLSPLRPNPTPTRAEARPAGVALLDAWA